MVDPVAGICPSSLAGTGEFLSGTLGNFRVLPQIGCRLPSRKEAKTFRFCNVLHSTCKWPLPRAIRMGAARAAEDDFNEDRTPAESFRTSCPGSAGGHLSALSDSLEISSQRHTRTAQDLPWQGLVVEIRIRAHKFRCRNPGCRQKIFAERLNGVAFTHARRTERLGNVIRLVGYSTGGLPGSRLLIGWRSTLATTLSYGL